MTRKGHPFEEAKQRCESGMSESILNNTIHLPNLTCNDHLQVNSTKSSPMRFYRVQDAAQTSAQIKLEPRLHPDKVDNEFCLDWRAFLPVPSVISQSRVRRCGKSRSMSFHLSATILLRKLVPHPLCYDISGRGR